MDTLVPEMTQLNSYPKVYQLGHKTIIDLLSSGPVVVEEKIDGSQFSFGVLNGELVCRSKGKQLILDNPEKMFNKAVVTAQDLAPLLHPGWIYRCEYVSKPKHNVICYNRAPEKFLIIYDIMTGPEFYLNPFEKLEEAKRIGLECVPLFFQGELTSLDFINEYLKNTSVLGGALIEGVVIKNYELITAEKKIAVGKYVSEKFKEVHTGDWKKRNPGQNDLVTQLITTYRTPARWQKAVQHLKERGELTGSPKDIGALMKEVSQDTAKECKDEIMEFLWKKFWSKISRGVTAGLPEWYKEELAKGAFSEN